jgi:DNA polymerase IV (archaeal DinB-like DNA polymerase)
MRIIGHLDMDAFFAAVEERDNPRFAGRPIVVGADPKEGRGRGVVSTANYKAREYGIRSALPISTAWKNAEAARRAGKPAVIFVAGHFEKYGEISHHIMEIVSKYAPHIEQASVDEAYFDLSRVGSYEAAEDMARRIKADIKENERLTASIGIGPNKLIAKVASDRNKPDGLTVVREEDAESFLEPLSVRTIPGIGPKTEMQLKELKVSTIKDAKKFSEAELKKMMGKWGPELYQKLRGRDSSPLVEFWEAKSIGEQKTFQHDVVDPKILNKALKELAAEVHDRFAESGFAAFRSITLIVRFSDFTTKTRATTLSKPVHDSETIQFQALRLFMPFFDARENPKRKAIRLIGVRLEKLS